MTKNMKRAAINNDALKKNKNIRSKKSADKTMQLDQLPNDIRREIFRRLPPANLRHCNCVSKAWQSIINDPEFQEDYRACRGLGAGLLISMRNRRGQDFYYSPLRFQKRDVENFRPRFRLPCTNITEVVRGLVCGYNNYGVHVCNVRSGRVTELPKYHEYSYRHVYFLGYDPVEGVHKLMCISRADYKWQPWSKCEILTIGRDSNWRQLPDVPAPVNHGKSFNNGFIYWRCWADKSIFVSFDLNKEKFSRIKFPGYQLPGYANKSSFLEFRGRLALVETHLHFLKLHILQDEGNNSWVEDSVSYPPELSIILNTDQFSIPDAIIQVGILPNGRLLLAKLAKREYSISDNLWSLEPLYSYDLQTNKFERFVVGKLPHSVCSSVDPMRLNFDIYCLAENVNYIPSHVLFD